MTIQSLVIKITNVDGTYIEPVYECHTWERAEEIIKNTAELIEGTGKQMAFSVLGR